VEATLQPQGIALAIKASLDDTGVSSDVPHEKICEEKGEPYTVIMQVWYLCERPRSVTCLVDINASLIQFQREGIKCSSYPSGLQSAREHGFQTADHTALGNQEGRPSSHSTQ